MIPAYAASLSVKVCSTNIEAQKIDGFTLETFRMVLTSFQVKDKLKKARFFQKTFLLTNTSVEVILGMPFLILNNVDM